jgi:signal transduction histidine kinase
LSLTNLSIEQRLPLLIGILVFGVIVAFTWVSYRGVKESALEVGRERLLNLTQQLASLTQQSAPLLTARTLTTANDPLIHAFLQDESIANRTRAVAMLHQFEATQGANSLQVELWKPDHSLALVEPEGSKAEPSDLASEFKQCAAEPFKTIGTVRLVKDVVAYPVMAAVKDGSGKPVGYLVRWRKASSTPEARKQLTDLLGSQAALYFGNSQGGVWTDLVKVVSEPPGGLQGTIRGTHYVRDGNSVMALGRPISGTPWFVVVEFPDQAFRAQANSFLRRMLVMGFGLLLVGVVGSFALSRTITRPLHSLTEAASVISTGDYSRLVDIDQNDELGKLANAFNAMVVEVRDSQEQLDLKVRERTAQLEAANKELAAYSDLTAEGLREKSLELAAMTQQMWQASKLATMGELAASVAHELNNPLATLALRAESLAGHFAADDPKRQSVEIIEQEVERMAMLVAGLLQFSRRSHRQVSTDDAAEEISNSINFISYYLRNRRVTVTTEFAPDVRTVQADRQQLRQLFLNLLTNACDAMPEGGTITTRVTRGELHGAEAVLVEFIDTGVGIPPANLERIWDSFFTTKPEGKGTGLGLAICRRIVEEHGGTILIESKVNEGTTVRILLPATANGNSLSEEAVLE